jgi:hypothetical protein
VENIDVTAGERALNGGFLGPEAPQPSRHVTDNIQPCVGQCGRRVLLYSPQVLSGGHLRGGSETFRQWVSQRWPRMTCLNQPSMPPTSLPGSRKALV